MKKHKGQVIVEFALILPFFLLIMYGIIYSGLMFHDYSTLSNIARASAREAAISVPSNYSTIAGRYKDLLNGLKTDFYVIDNTKPIVIEEVEDEDSVRTTINMKLNVNGYFVDMILPPTIGVQFYMKKEPAGS